MCLSILLNVYPYIGAVHTPFSVASPHFQNVFHKVKAKGKIKFTIGQIMKFLEGA
jgi:hypothetical protein